MLRVSDLCVLGEVVWDCAGINGLKASHEFYLLSVGGEDVQSNLQL